MQEENKKRKGLRREKYVKIRIWYVWINNSIKGLKHKCLSYKWLRLSYNFFLVKEKNSVKHHMRSKTSQPY